MTREEFSKRIRQIKMEYVAGEGLSWRTINEIKSLTEQYLGKPIPPEVRDEQEGGDRLRNSDTWGNAFALWIPLIPFWIGMVVGICLKDIPLTITGAVLYLGVIIDRNTRLR